MKKKILVLGSEGMVGHVVTLILRHKNNFDVIDVNRSGKYIRPSLQFELTDFKKLADVYSGLISLSTV